MLQAGKMEEIADELKYNIQITAFQEVRWVQDGLKREIIHSYIAD